MERDLKLKVTVESKEAEKIINRIEALKLSLKKISFQVDKGSIDKTLSDVNKQKLLDKSFKVIANISDAVKSLDALDKKKLSPKTLNVITKISDDVTKLKDKVVKVIADTTQFKSELAKIKDVSIKVKTIVDKITVKDTTIKVKPVLDKVASIKDVLSIKVKPVVDKVTFKDAQIKVIPKLDKLGNLKDVTVKVRPVIDKITFKPSEIKLKPILDKLSVKDSTVRIKPILDKLSIKDILSVRIKPVLDKITFKEQIIKVKPVLIEGKFNLKPIDVKIKPIIDKFYFKELSVNVKPVLNKLTAQDLKVRALVDKITLKDATVRVIPKVDKIILKDLFVNVKPTNVKVNTKEVTSGLESVNNFKIKDKVFTIRVNGKNVIKEVDLLDKKVIKGKTVFIATNKGTVEKDLKAIDERKLKDKTVNVKATELPSRFKDLSPERIAQVKKENDEYVKQIGIRGQQLAIEKQIAQTKKFEASRDAKISNLPVKSIDLNSANSLKLQVKYWKDIRDAADKSSGSFKTADGHIQRLTASLKQASGQAKGLSIFQKLEVGENITTIAAGFAGLGLVIAGAIKLVTGFGTALFQATSEGANFNVLNDNFTRLSGGVELAAEKLALLRQASSGNLNVQEIELYSNKMQLLGFSLDDTAKFFDVIEQKGDEIGVAFQTGIQAVESFIVSGRKLGLKQAGLDPVAITAGVEALAAGIGKTVASLEDEEAQAFRTKAILDLYGNTLEEIGSKSFDQADKIASLTTGMQNFQLSIKSFIANAAAPFIDASISIRAEFEKQLTAIGITGDFIEDLKTKFITLVTEGVTYLVDAYKKHLLPAVVEVIRQFKNLTRENPKLINDLKTVGKAIIDLSIAFDKFVLGSLAKFIEAIGAINRAFESGILKLLKDMATTLRDISTLRFDKLLDLFEADHDVTVTVTTIQKTINEVDDRFKTGHDVTKSADDAVRRNQERLNALKKSNEDFAKHQENLEKKKKPTGGTGSKTGGKSDTAKEIDELSDLIQLLQLRNSLIDQGQARAGDTLEKLRQELDDKKSLATTEEKILQFYTARKTLTDAIAKQEQETIDKILKSVTSINDLYNQQIDIGKAFAENTIKRLDAEIEAVKEIEQLRIDLMEEGFSKTQAQRKKDFDEQVRNIKAIKELSEESKKKQIDLLTQGFEQTTEKEKSAELKANLANAFDRIKETMDLLQIGTNTFVGQLIDGFSRMISLLTSAFNAIKAIQDTISIFKSILSVFIPGGGQIGGRRNLPGEGGGINTNNIGGIIDNRLSEQLKNIQLRMPEQNISPVINVYVKSELDGQKFVNDNFLKANDKRNYIRV